VEFFGDGVESLSLADRATIANMAPEYGATMGYFPIDHKAMDYLKQTGRELHTRNRIEEYLRNQGLFRDYKDFSKDPTFTGSILELDLASVEPCVSGPKRPHDRVPLSKMKTEWNEILTAKTGFKGFGLDKESIHKSTTFTFKGKDYTFKQG